MSYSNITTTDPNPVKRWLQKSRFKTALHLYPQSSVPLTVLDFGGGNGYLCLELAKIDQRSTFLCYDPSPIMRSEATETIGNHPRIKVLHSLHGIAEASVDISFSLEVFEHLPQREAEEALQTIFSLTKTNGRVIFGVPNELFGAAMYKGLFRMVRRYGEFDATPLNILGAILGSPPKNRPIDKLDDKLQYYFHHLGFDHRNFRNQLSARNLTPRKFLSPSRYLGELFSPEIYYVVDREKNFEH